MLHITNGDSAGGVLQHAIAAGLLPAGPVLPWRDVLHEGPVRAGLPLEALSVERARFIAQAGWGEASEVARSFAERDAAFRRAGEHDEIVLWFEHDLFDQLQLIQVLDALRTLGGPPISLICEAEYVGTMTPERVAELFSLRNPVTRRHLQEAEVAWAAFRSPDPSRIDSRKPQALAYLGPALRRLLQEYPWTTDGLSLLERRVVEVLRGGALPFPRPFLGVEEDPAFLGDAVLAWHLERLAQEGLVDGAGERWSSKQWRLTGRERARRVPRWLGGYEMKDETLRWDPALARLVAAA